MCKGRPKNFKCSDITREKMRIAKLNTKLSIETKEKISNSLLGVKKSTEHKNNISIAKTNNDKIIEELIEMYGDNPECLKWIQENESNLKFFDNDFTTEKYIKNKQYINTPSLTFLENHPQIFPLYLPHREHL